MVDWMINSEKLATRDEAVKLSQKLADLNLIQHVVERQPFTDKLLFFEFRVSRLE